MAGAGEVVPGFAGHQLLVRHRLCLANLGRLRNQKLEDGREDLGWEQFQVHGPRAIGGVGVSSTKWARGFIELHLLCRLRMALYNGDTTASKVGANLGFGTVRRRELR